MQNPGHIKNPLTIIAIFAGLSEVSGTVVLPLIAPENQFYFMWFVMTFPMALIMLFFSVLVFNHKVLYAPSDFQNEKYFVDLMPTATTSQKLEKLKEEALQEVEEDPQQLPPIVGELNVVESDDTLSGQITTEVANDPPDDPPLDRVQQISRLEDMVFTWLQRRFVRHIARGVTAMNGHIFDGMVQQSGELIAIEVKIYGKVPPITAIVRAFEQMLDAGDGLHVPPELKFVHQLVIVADGVPIKPIQQAAGVALRHLSDRTKGRLGVEVISVSQLFNTLGLEPPSR